MPRPPCQLNVVPKTSTCMFRGLGCRGPADCEPVAPTAHRRLQRGTDSTTRKTHTHTERQRNACQICRPYTQRAHHLWRSKFNSTSTDSSPHLSTTALTEMIRRCSHRIRMLHLLADALELPSVLAPELVPNLTCNQSQSRRVSRDQLTWKEAEEIVPRTQVIISITHEHATHHHGESLCPSGAFAQTPKRDNKDAALRSQLLSVTLPTTPDRNTARKTEAPAVMPSVPIKKRKKVRRHLLSLPASTYMTAT